jgi:hypothetical protein
MSGHKCTEEIYQAFLQASSTRYTALALSEVSPKELSHDSVSRWLGAQDFRPRDLWSFVKTGVQLDKPGVLIIDDSVLEKPRSKKIELVRSQYSGNSHRPVAGIGLVNLLWHSTETKEHIPVDYRIYDKSVDGKTKNVHFREMLELAKNRGLNPEAVAMDCWYSSLANLKLIRSLGMHFVCGLRSNRTVNGKPIKEQKIPAEGLIVHLRGFGTIRVFQLMTKNGHTDYIGTSLEWATRDEIKALVGARWSVEVYHRELKQTCGIECCRSRSGRAQRNHIFLAISAWFEQFKRRCYSTLSFYQQKWNVIKRAISAEMRRLLLQPSC